MSSEMTLYDLIMRAHEAKLTKSELGDIVSSGIKSDIDEAIKAMEDLGGYENLPD